MSAPLCQPPRSTARPPRIAPPPGACDCHYHVFGPHHRFPLGDGRSYTPPEASVEAFERVQATLGLRRGVIVQASVYGTDNSCMMDALARLGPDRARGVAVIYEETDPAELASMHAAGVRGVRINAVSGNGTPVAQIERVARSIAPLGWHLQLYVGFEAIASLAPILAGLPVPVVIDHMGGLEPRAGLASPEFQALLRLLDREGSWIKLCGYRCSHERSPYADVAPFARALAQAAPDRCVWGTDWPHPAFEGEMPDDGGLLDALAEWLPDAATRHRVLVDNPSRLYGFPAA